MNKKTVRVTVGSGSKVHVGYQYNNGRFFTACGAGEVSTGTKRRSFIRLAPEASDVTCQRCLKITSTDTAKEPEEEYTPVPGVSNCGIYFNLMTLQFEYDEK